MFTGIVQGVAEVTLVAEVGGFRTICLAFPAGFANGLASGSSVSVDGVCLTVTSIVDDRTATFDVVRESLGVTSLGECRAGDLVNVERAAKQGDEIGGHLLSGHIDFSAPVLNVRDAEGNKSIRVAIPQQFRQYVFRKGYIALNGCSLTVAECDKIEGWFEAWLIPETRRASTLDGKRPGDRVNVEIDRTTQAVVDTVREALRSELRPLLEAAVSGVAEAPKAA